MMVGKVLSAAGQSKFFAGQWPLCGSISRTI